LLFLKPFSFYGEDSLPIYMERQRHPHSGSEPAGCRGTPVVLSSLPKPAGICVLWVLSPGWSCSGRIQKGTIRQGIRTHVWYVGPLVLNAR